MKKEQDNYEQIPMIRKIDNAIVQRNYLQVKKDVEDIVDAEIERLNGDPSLQHLIIQKGQ